jgi:hypothetical protein
MGYFILTCEKKLISNLIIKIANSFQLIKNLFIHFREFLLLSNILLIYIKLFMALKVRLFEN